MTIQTGTTDHADVPPMLTVTVTCYNEEELVTETLETLVGALQEFTFPWEVIVIDDVSTDASTERVRDFQRRNPDLPVYLRVNRSNQGFGYNYVQGAFLGRGEYYRVVCADNCEPRETLVTIFGLMGQADVIIPYYPAGENGRSRFRTGLSRLYTGLVNVVSGHRVRYYNGLILSRREDVLRWHGNYRGFGIQADLLTKLLDAVCSKIEVAVQDTDQKGAGSTALRLKNVLSVVHTILDLILRRLLKLSRRQRNARPRPVLIRETPGVAGTTPGPMQSTTA